MKFSTSTNIPECNIKEKQACSTWWNQATATENKPNMNVSILTKVYPYGISKIFFICLHFATQKLYLVNLTHTSSYCVSFHHPFYSYYMSKCPWVRHWTPSGSLCIARVCSSEWVNERQFVKRFVRRKALWKWSPFAILDIFFSLLKMHPETIPAVLISDCRAERRFSYLSQSIQPRLTGSPRPCPPHRYICRHGKAECSLSSDLRLFSTKEERKLCVAWKITDLVTAY